MRAKDYERQLADLTAFLNSVDQVLAMSRPVDTHGLYPTWRPRDGRGAQFTQEYLTATRLSGRAVRAFETSGVRLAWQGTSHNPAMLWSTMFERAALLEPARLHTLGQQAMGILDEFAQRQRSAERGLAGLMARILLFPASVREAAGLDKTSVRGRAVTTGVVVLQTFVLSIVAGVTVQGLSRALGWS